MKTRAITVAFILGGFSAAICQSEYDDVYFTKKDRVFTASVQESKPQKSLDALSESNAAFQAVSPSISMAGYTGRTINPDYQPGGSVSVTSSYFTPNYQPARVNNQLNQYNQQYNQYNNSYYNNYNSPYSNYSNRFGYGGGYSPYGLNSWGYSPYSSYGSYGSYYNPYYSNFGYSSMGYSSFGFGNGFSGMYSGMGYGCGNGFYGNGMMGYGGYYPSNVVIVNNPDNHVNKVYGKRESRSSDYASANSGNYAGRGSMISSADQSQGNRGGRVASNTSSNAYYQRGWRQDPSITQSSSSSGSRSSGYSPGNSGGSRSSWSAFGNTTPTHGNSGFGNSGFGGARTDIGGGSFSSGGGNSGGRSSGGSSGGGHSSGGTRGRN